MHRGALIGGVALLVVGGVAIGFAVTRQATGGMTPAGSAAMGAAKAELDGAINTTRAQVQQRAKGLAETSELRGAIGTDAATTMERIGKEIAFKPDDNEVLALTQQAKAGGATSTLLLLPDTTMKPAHDGSPGTYTELIGDQALVTQVVEVTPSDKEAAQKFSGFVTVSRKLGLKPAVDKLIAAGVTGRLEIGTATLAIGSPPANAKTEVMKLPSQDTAQLVVAVPPATGGMPVPLLAGGAGLAGLGLLFLIIGMLRKQSAGATAVAGAPFATTQYPPQTGVAAGTPSPVGLSLSSVGGADTALPGFAGSSQLGPAIMDAGAQIGRWLIIKRLGSGGMADVFLAHSKGEAGFEKQVALKVMHSHLARNERAVAHFLDEARLAARVQHPNVVAIQDLGKIGNDYVIVMDYVEGVDLERLLASARNGNRQVPLEVALGIMCRICDGLNAAHTATSPDGTPLGIIHRDVKSANVLVSKGGAVKVVDFGIAKAAAQAHFTIAGETKGTPSMMAPEQRIGEQVDIRADVYSVAAVGYEVLTGSAVNLDLATLAHLGVEKWPHLPPPSIQRPGLPVELDQILLGAMSFERDKRPADCVAFAALFERVMKTYQLTASDKDIARWFATEHAIMQRGAEPVEIAAPKLAPPT